MVIKKLEAVCKDFGMMRNFLVLKQNSLHGLIAAWAKHNTKIDLTMLKLVSDPNLPYVTITHKFSESGHNFKLNDANFSYIKKTKYHPEVYPPNAAEGKLWQPRKLDMAHQLFIQAK